MDKTLDAREWRVLELRFGHRDGRQRTLEEVGQEFCVTRERIRQIERTAILKMFARAYGLVPLSRQEYGELRDKSDRYDEIVDGSESQGPLDEVGGK